MSTGFSRTSSIRVLAVLMLGVVIAGCLDRVVTGPEHGVGSLTGPASKISIDAGDGQKAVISTQLPVAASALVTDDQGYAVAGTAVTFKVVTGGGRVELARATTDSTGRISARWTLGTVAGLQTITASIATGAVVTFKATADAGVPASVVQESGSGQTGAVGRTLATSVAVRVVDGYGNNVRGVAVTWTAEDGSIAATAGTTDSLGRSLARWTLGNRTGTQSAAATVAGASPVGFVAIAQAGSPSAVTLETGDKQTQTIRQTLPLPLVARVTDQFNNGVSGVAVTWAAASGGGSLLSTSATSDATGRATAVWTMGAAAGSQLATMAVAGLPLTVYTATAVAASGDSLLIEAGNNQTGTVSAALGTPLLIRVRDTSGNPVVGTSVIFAIASGGGAVAPSLAVTDANGRAQSTWTLGAFAGLQTVTATVGSKVVTFTATGAAVGSGGGTLTPSQLVLVSGNGQSGTVGQTLGSQVVVQVIDASGIPVPGVNVTWTLAAANSGGLASPTVSRTDGSGTASLLWTLGSRVGLQQVTASATGLTSLALQASAQIGSSGAVVIDNGNGQKAGSGSLLGTNLRVLVVDQSGTPVIGARVNWAVASGGGTISKSSGTSNASGLDSLAWTLGATAGAQTVTATVTGVPVVTFTATASTPAAASLVKIAGDLQTARAGTKLPGALVVEARNASGAPVAGITVTFASPTSPAVAADGAVDSTVVVTGVDGRAKSNWTVGPNAGETVTTATMRASVQGPPALTADFTASVRPSLRIRMAPTALLPAGVTNALTQSDTTGATRGDTLQVQVYDPSISDPNNGVQGIAVTFATGSESCSEGYPINSVGTTNVLGLAKTRWVLKSPAFASSCPGLNALSKTLAISPDPVAKRMRATAATSLGEVEFQTVVSPGRVTDNFLISGMNADSVSIASVSTRSRIVTVTVRDVNGYPISGATVKFTPTTGSGVVGTGVATVTTTTVADGTTQVVWTIAAAAGEQRLTVEASKAATPYATVFTATKDYVVLAKSP